MVKIGSMISKGTTFVSTCCFSVPQDFITVTGFLFVFDLGLVSVSVVVVVVVGSKTVRLIKYRAPSIDLFCSFTLAMHRILYAA